MKTDREIALEHYPIDRIYEGEATAIWFERNILAALAAARAEQRAEDVRLLLEDCPWEGSENCASWLKKKPS